MPSRTREAIMVNTLSKALLVLALLAGSGVACGSADSVLRVNLDPSDVSSVTLLASQVTIGNETRTMDIASPDGQPISLTDGTSYTLEIPHQYSGPTQVFVAGLDAANTVVLNGAGSLDSLNQGHLNEVEVVWLTNP
jgi:hypothetical protein